MKKRSKLGYKRYSPDVNNPYNIIPSGRITMKDVDFPVYGVDNFGNEQMMYPGREYQFPGNQVFELPIKQGGGEQLPMAQNGKSVGSALSEYKERPYENFVEVFDISGLTSWDDAKRAYDSWQESGQSFPSFEQGLDMFGAVPALGKLGKLRYLANPGAMKSVYKYIPWQQIVNTLDSAEDELEKQSEKKQIGGEQLPMAQFGGMRRSKVDRILNENRDLNFVQRMYQSGTPSIMIPGQDGPSTHYMESADGKVYPTVVQMPDGNLQYLGDRAYDYANETGNYIQFKNDRQAGRFAKNYKKGTGVLKGFQSGGKLLYHPGSDTYYGPELEEAVVIGEKSKDYPYADQLDERSRQYWRENYSDKNNAIVRGIKSRARIGDKKGLYGELESLANNALTTAAEFSGLAGSARFSQDPKANLIGAGQAIENFLLGTNPMASSFLNTEITPEQSEQFFNTLDVVGMAGAAGPMVKGMAKPISNLTADLSQAALRQFSRPVENVAMGNVDKIIADLATARRNQLFKLKGSVNDKRVKLRYHKGNPIILDRSQKIPTKRGTSFILKEEPVFYRTTTPEKFERIMDPISTVGNPDDRAQNLRFFTPNRDIARNYMDVYNHGDLAISARMNIKNPYFQSSRTLTNEYVQNKIAQGYDAIVTRGHDGNWKKLRNAYEIIPLDKQLLYDIQKLERFQRGGQMYKNTRNRRPSPTTYSSGYKKGGGEQLPMAQAGLNWRDVAPRPDISERRDATQVTRHVVSNPSSRPDPRNFPTSTISQYEEPSAATKVLNTLANPVESFGYLARGQRIPDRVGPSSMDMALDMVNPFAWANYARKSVNDLSEGNFVSAGFNALGAIPAAGFADEAARVLNYATTRTPLRNTYKYNPYAFKPNPEAYYRLLGKEGVNDAFESGMIRANPKDIDPFSGEPFYDRPYFSKGEPFDRDWKSPFRNKKGKQAIGSIYPDETMVEVFGHNKFHPTNDLVTSPINTLHSLDDGVNFYKRDWLRGYKPVNISRKRYQQGGLVKAQFGIQTAAFMPMMAQAYGAASSWFNDDSKPAATPAPAVPEIVDWRKLSRPKQIDYAIGELTAFEKEENRKALENLLESTAYMENRYGEDPRAYGRDYTSSFMSIDPIALKDMFTGRGANGAYNSAQRRQFETFKQLDLPTDQKQFDALLREDNPVAAMAAARYRYALVPQALPSANDQQGMFDYWLKYYNGSGILKHKTRAEAYKDFQRAYQRALSND